MKKFIIVLLCTLLLSGCGVELKNGENAIVTFKGDEGISSNDLYKTLKDLYGVDRLIEIIDTTLLEKEYEKTTEEAQYINQKVLTAKKSAESYEATLESYLIYMFGLNTEKEYIEYERLNYRRLLWTEDFAKVNVTEKQISDYYETTTIGDIEASHILITSTATSDMTDAEKKEAENEARKKAVEIIDKLKKGEKFEDLAKKYSEDTSNASEGGYLGFFNYDDNFDENFMKASINLKVGEYSKAPVKSQFGYHIIYKTDQKDKPSLEDAKEEIINVFASELVQDQTFQLKAIKALREKYEMKIVDSELDSAYEKLMVRLENQASQSTN